MKNNILKNIASPMATKGLRTICLAYREFVTSETTQMNQTLITSNVDWTKEANIIKNLTFIAIFGIEDPIRPEVIKIGSMQLDTLYTNCIQVITVLNLNVT